MRIVRMTAAVLASVFFLGSASADDPDSTVLPKPFPVPMAPTPSADTPTTLRPGEWYIISRDDPFIVLASPPGFVTIANEANLAACPVKIKGAFAGGGGKLETKTFTGKQITTVAALATGRCELLIIPIGFKNESDIIRRVIDVEAGQGPQPPPVVTPPTGKYYFMIVRPNTAATREIADVLALPAWVELTKDGHTVKDKTFAEATALGLTLPAGTTIPCVVTLQNDPAGSKVVAGPVPLPTTNEAIRALPKLGK